MKIALFVHCFFPSHFYGTETYTLELAQNYKKWGHDVTVVSAVFQGEPAAADLITRYEYAGIPVVCIDKNRVPHGNVKETYYQPEMRPVLERVLREIRPDVVHVTHLINHTSALLEVTNQLGIPTYGTFTDFFGFCFNNKLEASNSTLCKGPSPTRMNCVACYIKDVLKPKENNYWARQAVTNRNPERIASVINIARHFPGVKNSWLSHVIQDIVDRPEILVNLYNKGYTAAVAPTKFLRSAYESNGINVPMQDIWFGIDIDRSPKPHRMSGHKPVIGFIGQIARHKGVDILIDAFQRLPKGSAELHIYGPPDQEPHYMQQLRDMTISDEVRFCGTFPKEKMHEILKSMDALAIPSRWYENSPLVLLNALATHTPVIVSNVAGMTEFLAEGENGYSFERGSVNSLEQVLKKLLVSPDKLFEMSLTTRFDRTPEHMAEQTLKIYAGS